MTELEELKRCLREARRLGNKTVRSESEMNALHREMDRLLQGDGDDVCERFDAPHRVAHRKFVDSLFERRSHEL